MDIKVNGVNITLTKDQLKEIDRQVKGIRTISDIVDYQSALEILGEDRDYSSKISPLHKLLTMIRAANYLDNGKKPWKADFTQQSVAKFIVYLERKHSGWVAISVGGCDCASLCPVGFYFKERATAEHFMKEHLNLYNEVWEG